MMNMYAFGCGGTGDRSVCTTYVTCCAFYTVLALRNPEVQRGKIGEGRGDFADYLLPKLDVPFAVGLLVQFWVDVDIYFIV
jgi:hypothetical protein